MREQALLENRLCETEKTGRSGIERPQLDWDPCRRGENLSGVIAGPDQPQGDWIRGHTFRNDGADVLAAGRLRRRLFLHRRGMHWARIRRRFRNRHDNPESAMIRKGKPGDNRDRYRE